MNQNYVLLTDSSCDLPASVYKEYNVFVTSLSYTIDGATYKDTADQEAGLESHVFYEKLRAGSMATTSMVNIAQYRDFFEPFLKEGKDLLYLCFSSALSGSFSCAVAARNDLAEAYPERTIVVVDSLCASMGEGLLLLYAIKKRDEGLDILELRDWLEENRTHINHLFTVDSLMHLHRGGRVSIASAMLGSLIGIKPVLNVSPQGALTPWGKVRGRRQSLDRLVSWMGELSTKNEYDLITISHGDCLEDAQYVEKLVRKRFKVGALLINPVGPVIGAHAGPGVVALFFKDGPREERS